jgi:hypothetical protein
MCSAGGQAADWRDAAAYAPLLAADRSIFAWEWLRRDPGYRAAAERAFEANGQADDESEAPARWGLHAFEPPNLAAPDARPVWSADVHPYVLEVDAEQPTEASDVFDPERYPSITRIVVARDGREHLLISEGLRTIRLDVLAGSLAGGPARLRYRLSGLASAEHPLLTLRRFLALSRTGRFASSLHPREARARRMQLMLRAHDALATGADQREIAAELLSREAGELRWRSRCPSVRLQVQRLVRGARHMTTGGYFELLR